MTYVPIDFHATTNDVKFTDMYVASDIGGSNQYYLSSGAYDSDLWKE